MNKLNDTQQYTLEETKHLLLEDWAKKNISIEIAISEGSRVIHDPDERKIVQYSLSSSNRRKFLMHIIRATYENNPITVTELTKLIGITRNSVETIVKQCSEAGWINVNRCSKNCKYLTACDNLLNCYENYSYWLWQQVHTSGLRDLSSKIGQISNMINRLPSK
jgi:DNA-binding MarR family transcriptional regulator